MFVYLGNKFVNTAFIQEISHAASGQHERAVKVKFADGRDEVLSCPENFLHSGVLDNIIPATSSYKAIAPDRDENGDLSPSLHDIVAFRYHASDTDLYPVTVRAIDDVSILMPDGSVLTPDGATDSSLDAYTRRKAAEMGLEPAG